MAEGNATPAQIRAAEDRLAQNLMRHQALHMEMVDLDGRIGAAVLLRKELKAECVAVWEQIMLDRETTGATLPPDRSNDEPDGAA